MVMCQLEPAARTRFACISSRSAIRSWATRSTTSATKRGQRPAIRVTLPVPLERRALHAYKLGLVHPETGRKVSWEAEPPEDMQDLIEALDFEGYAARQVEDDDDDFDDDDDPMTSRSIYVKDDDDD